MSHQQQNKQPLLPSSNHNPNIDAAELVQRLADGQPMHLVDVREPMEFYSHNIGGVNIPLAQLPLKLEELEAQKAHEIILVCKAGLRSRTAQSILQQNGYLHTRNLTGGLLAVQKLKRL